VTATGRARSAFLEEPGGAAHVDEVDVAEVLPGRRLAEARSQPGLWWVTWESRANSMPSPPCGSRIDSPFRRESAMPPRLATSSASLLLLVCALGLLLFTQAQPAEKNGINLRGDAGKAPAFTMESNPNHPLAVGPKWKAQSNPAEVLKGWKIRYTAPDPPGGTWSKVEWYVDALPLDGVFKKVGEGNPFDREEDKVGLFLVKYKGTDSTGNVAWSGPRPHCVTDISVPAGPGGFDLVAGGEYTKTGFMVTPPDPVTDPAMRMSGQVNRTAGSPTVFKIGWGFVQRVSATRDMKLEYASHTFDPASPPGTTTSFPSYYKTQHIPSSILVNDAPRGPQLFSGHAPFRLGFPEAVTDTPSHPPGGPHSWRASDGKPATIEYRIKQDHMAYWKFTTWLVVGNRVTYQWVPLRQRGWTLQWDTREAGPWRAEPDAAETTPMTQPPDTTHAVEEYLFAESGSDFLTKTK
jgi:hypothetical protein